MVGDIIYPNVDESRFSGLYSSNGSRPNILICRYVSALILKRMYRLSDEVLLEFIRCGSLNFQYALHTTQEETQPLSESSLRRFRRKVEAYNHENSCDLIKDEFERISRKMAVDMGVLHEDVNAGEDDDTVTLVRMDSMEIEAHAKAMTRIEILYTTNLIVIRYLLKKGFKDIIPESLLHYLSEDDHNKVMYYRVAEDKKAGVQDNRVAEAVKEMIQLQSAMQEHFGAKLLETIPEYKVFQRVLEEQTRLDDQGERVPKDKKDISPDSVQNPFDATVTYRYKRGQHHGHVLNAAEAVDDSGNGIIVHATVEPNTASDSTMAKEYMEQLPDNGPKQIFTADGAYNSDKLKELAAKKNVTIQTTSLTGKETNDVFADFVLNDEETAILSCPAGKVPTSCNYNPNNGRITAKMPDNCCATCPHREQCKAKVCKKRQRSSVSVTGKNGRPSKSGKIILDRRWQEKRQETQRRGRNHVRNAPEIRH